MRNEMKSAFGGKKILLWLAVVAVVAGGVIGGIYYKKSQGANGASKPFSEAQVEQINLKVVELTGVQGKSVLDLLKDKTAVEYSDSASGAFITSINDIKNTDKEFWLYSVNGVDATVAADKYITKDGDQIKWEYKGF